MKSFWCFLLGLLSAATVWSLNAPRLASPDPNTCLKTVGYWGQNTLGTRFNDPSMYEKPLGSYCEDSTFDILIVSFMHIFYEGNPPLPGLNFAYHCGNAPFPGYPNLLVCPAIAADIKKCQAKGKIILLSMGGAASNGLFVSEQAGIDFADMLWKMFMGGSDPSIPRPFGDSIFDGIDLDIEGGSPVGYGSFALRLRTLYAQDTVRTYYIGAAPQCPYPDAYLGPTGSYTRYALGVAPIDFVFIQFYNNFCGIQNFGSFFNFDTWHQWATETKTQLFLGVPGASFSGAGFQPASQVITISNSLINSYGPKQSGWYAGVMMWDAGTGNYTDGVNGQTFAGSISSSLKSQSVCGATPPPPPPSPPPPPPSPPPPPPSPPPPPPSPPPPPPSPPPSTCDYAGPPSSGPGGLFRNLNVPNSPDPVMAMSTTIHLSSALTLDPSNLDAQIQSLLSSPNYDNSGAWKPNSDSDADYVCPFIAPPSLYESNPTQMLIGLPNVGTSTTISNTQINIRLPDKIFGMFLAYAMDEYGMNPHVLMGLAAKESFTTAVAPNNGDSNNFLANNVTEGYDLYGPHIGYGTDGNKDGPFQVERFAAATAFSIFPGRVNMTVDQQEPSFDLDTTIASSPNLPVAHAYWVTNIYRAVVLTSLDFHYRYNALLLVPGFGMRASWDSRSNGKQRDALEFASLMYAYNRGMYSDLKTKICACPPTSDPISQCGLDGFGGHGSAIKSVCKLLDQSPNTYDFPLDWSDVLRFIGILKTTYPYSINGASVLYGSINWSQITVNTKRVYDLLVTHRQGKGGSGGISFRYDWRALLAAIRCQLPMRDDLVGPTWYGMVQWSFGKIVGTDPGYDFDKNAVPFGFQSEAGNRTPFSGSPPSPPPPPPPPSPPPPPPSPPPPPPPPPPSPPSPPPPPPSPPPPPPDSPCICRSSGGYADTTAPNWATKRCDRGFGVTARQCAFMGTGCVWGLERRFCTGNRA